MQTRKQNFAYRSPSNWGAQAVCRTGTGSVMAARVGFPVPQRLTPSHVWLWPIRAACRTVAGRTQCAVRASRTQIAGFCGILHWLLLKFVN